MTTPFLILVQKCHQFDSFVLNNVYKDFFENSVCYLEGQRKKVKSLSRVQLFAIPWTVAYQAPPSMGFSRQEYWSGFPFPSPGDLPNPRMEPGSPAFQADALSSEPPGWPLLSFTNLRVY